MGSVPFPVPLRPRPGEDGAGVGKFLAGKFPAGKFQVSRFVPMLLYECRSSSVFGL